MRIALSHPGTGDTRFVETGWSWTLFWFAGFFGLPLFFRGLALWGAVMATIWSMQVAASTLAVTSERAASMHWLLGLASLGLCLYLGFQGNALTARHLFACGYDFSKPDSAEARFAMDSWNL